MISRFKFVHMMTTVIVVLNLVGMLIFNICYDTVYSNCSEMGYIEQIVYSWVYISCLVKINKMNCELMLTYDTPALRQSGSRNLTSPKTLPTIWGTYMKLVTKYQISKGEGSILFYLCPSVQDIFRRIFLSNYWCQISDIWSQASYRYAILWETFLDPSDQNRQTGSRNLTDPKTLPTLWYTYMTLVTKYQISAINSYWKKCDEKYLGRTEGRSYRYTIMWVAFLDPSDSYFLFADFVDFYTHLTYICICTFFVAFSKQLLMTGIWYLVTSFI
jgi:hypothetical protein